MNIDKSIGKEKEKFADMTQYCMRCGCELEYFQTGVLVEIRSQNSIRMSTIEKDYIKEYIENIGHKFVDFSSVYFNRGEKKIEKLHSNVLDKNPEEILIGYFTGETARKVTKKLMKIEYSNLGGIFLQDVEALKILGDRKRVYTKNKAKTIEIKEYTPLKRQEKLRNITKYMDLGHIKCLDRNTIDNYEKNHYFIFRENIEDLEEEKKDKIVLMIIKDDMITGLYKLDFDLIDDRVLKSIKENKKYNLTKLPREIYDKFMKSLEKILFIKKGFLSEKNNELEESNTVISEMKVVEQRKKIDEILEEGIVFDFEL